MRGRTLINYSLLLLMIHNMHWMLAVMSPWNGLVYWLDPLGAENEINSFATKIIAEGLIKFSMIHRKDIKKIKQIQISGGSSHIVLVNLHTQSIVDILFADICWIL